MKKLADWLTTDYEVRGNEIIPKKEMKININDEEIKLGSKDFWVLGHSAKGGDVVVRATPLLTHPFCLFLADKFKNIVKLHTAKREYHRFPIADNNYHGYMTIVNEDGLCGDGEVHSSNVPKHMIGYSTTLMHKRAEDRLILRALGLYQQGFYSEAEFDEVRSVSEGSNNTITPEETEKIEKNRLIKEIGSFFEEYPKLFPDRSGYVYQILGKQFDKPASITLDETKKLHNSIISYINNKTNKEENTEGQRSDSDVSKTREANNPY